MFVSSFVGFNSRKQEYSNHLLPTLLRASLNFRDWYSFPTAHHTTAVYKGCISVPKMSHKRSVQTYQNISSLLGNHSRAIPEITVRTNSVYTHSSSISHRSQIRRASPRALDQSFVPARAPHFKKSRQIRGTIDRSRLSCDVDDGI